MYEGPVLSDNYAAVQQSSAGKLRPAGLWLHASEARKRRFSSKYIAVVPLRSTELANGSGWVK